MTARILALVISLAPLIWSTDVVLEHVLNQQILTVGVMAGWGLIISWMCCLFVPLLSLLLWIFE